MFFGVLRFFAEYGLAFRVVLLNVEVKIKMFVMKCYYFRIFKHGVSSTVFLVSTTCPKVHLFKEVSF